MHGRMSDRSFERSLFSICCCNERLTTNSSLSYLAAGILSITYDTIGFWHFSRAYLTSLRTQSEHNDLLERTKSRQALFRIASKISFPKSRVPQLCNDSGARQHLYPSFSKYCWIFFALSTSSLLYEMNTYCESFVMVISFLRSTSNHDQLSNLLIFPRILSVRLDA